MKMTNQIKRIFASVLALVMIVGMMPVSAFAATEEPIVLIAGGDYQQAGDHANSSANVTNILKQVTAAGLTTVDGFLFIGDYDCETHDSSSETSAGIASLMSTMQDVYSNLNYDNTILVQGNHDYPDSRIDASGGHTFDGYSVFVMNEDDYPNYGGSSSQAQSLSQELADFLEEKLVAGYTAPIFVTSHVPLHFGPRTNKQGDGKYGKYYFDVMNAYGAEGLNIIFMHGHNHAYGYDEYMGGEAIYLAVGDKINIAVSGSQSSYTTETLNFTYMNAGYTGYYNESGYSTSSGTDFLTMTTFQIYEDRVVVNRFSEDGLYNMKSAGQLKGDYISSVSVSANSAVYASAQTIALNAPAERITLTDNATGVKVTGVKTEGTFDDASDLVVTGDVTVDILDNAAKCADYRAYTLAFSNDAAVSITLPMPETFTKSAAKVYRVENNALTEVDATITDTAASFVAEADGTYALVLERVISTGGVTYERVDSVSDLTSGGEYLIVFDCSSQTTADAIVMPEIATYSSGSSKRVGPDVIVSDGIGDEDIITGDYDNYLWTLTKSGSGWLIGNGSQNIDVTYSSTTSRCELNFTSAGEALTIASVSSNPSDADSNSFAIYDSSSYYWQYNTSATLIYGTNGDSYTSRFHFYKRVENTTTDSEIDNGWVSLPSGGTYVLDTDGIDIGENHRYIIVGNSNAYALTVTNGTVGQTAVTVSGNTISVDDPTVYEFYFADNSSNESGSYLLTQDGRQSVYHANGNMYYGSDNKGYWHIGSNSNGSYQLYDYDNMNWYLNYGYVWSSESVSRFAVSSNARYVRLYKSTSSVYGDTYIRLSGDLEQAYTIAAAATEESVLKNVAIEVTTDGYHVSETMAVTSDMVTWDVPFSGTTAGTYTGIVTYEGEELGTVTVTITAEHSFETTTVDATCTEKGTITTTCTICGESTVEEIEALGHDYACVVTEATCGKDGSKVYTCSRCDDSYSEVIAATGKHTYETTTVDATCTEKGTITTICTVCGDSTVEEIEALGHDYACVVTEATCGKDGSKVYTCTRCDDSYSEVIAATGKHTYETTTVDATCTEKGSITTTCTVCGESTVEEIAALGHDYACVVTEATCGKDGSKVYTCTRCDDSYSEVIPATGDHVYESETVEATCIKDGSVTYTCVCGHSYSEVIPATGVHAYEAETVEATCGTAGSVTYTCATCGGSYTEEIPATGEHTYESVTVEATCTETGSVTHTCSICGYSYSEVIAALGHNYTSTVTAPTCTEDGYTTYTCSVCGDSYTDGHTEALGHAYTSKVTATCTEDGFVVYTCATCGDTYNGEAVAAFGHDYTTTVVEPTCGKDGYTTYVCATCGHSYTGDIVTAPGHAYDAVVTEATCTEGGWTEYTCTECGDYYVSDYTAALGHVYNSVVTEPTFEEMGYTTHTCTVCGDVVVDSYVPVKTHSYVTETVAATCEDDGYITYTCTECGYSYTETIAAFGHAFEIVTTDPTCEAEGAIVSTCVTCGHVETEVIPALGHDFEIVTIDPTCENDGYTTYTCACGHVETETAPALGHQFETVTTDPTCTEAGAITDTCAVCGYEQIEVIAALGHSYVSQSTAPTCTEVGYTTYTCSVCGDSYTADEVEALGHAYEAVVTAPTCTESGYTTYTCSVCGDIYTADEVAALGHNYSTVETDGYLVYTCDTCGDSYSEKLTVELSYNNVTAFTAGNSYVITVKSGSKYYALSHANNSISAVQVTVSGSEITSEITEDLLWNYSDSKLSYESNGTTYYLYTYSSGGWWFWWGTPTLSISSTNSSTVSISNNKLKIGSYYLRYSSSKFSANSSGTTLYLYEETEE